MKNTITRKTLIIIFLIIQILQIISSAFNTVQANIKEGDNIELKGDHECDSLLEYWMKDYNKWSYKIVWYVYYNDPETKENIQHFALNHKKKVLEQDIIHMLHQYLEKMIIEFGVY